jgi:hypothetical protein
LFALNLPCRLARAADALSGMDNSDMFLLLLLLLDIQETICIDLMLLLIFPDPRRLQSSRARSNVPANYESQVCGNVPKWQLIEQTMMMLGVTMN